MNARPLAGGAGALPEVARDPGRWPPAALLPFVAASAAGVALVVARCVVAGHLGLLYLPWNLFLAWIPLGCALLARQLAPPAAPRRGWVFMAAAGWLLFFPNAPYILTDLAHVTEWRTSRSVPPWFDLQLHVLFAVTGLLLGFASLRIMHELVRRFWGTTAGWLFSVISLGLAGFGVYLGRFLRWNSWDLVRSPVSLLGDVAQQLVDPLRQPRTFGFTALFFLCLVLSYLMCAALGGWQSPRQTRE